MPWNRPPDKSPIPHLPKGDLTAARARLAELREIERRPVVKNGLYRGTLIYDDERPQRCDAGTGKRNDPEYNRERSEEWRDRHREELRTYMREYQRKRRKKIRESRGIDL